MTETAPKTASDRARELNANFRAECEARGSQVIGVLVEDAEFWAGWGIHTAAELDHHLAASTYIDMYKEANGIKPRWMDLDAYSTEELEQMIEELSEEMSLLAQTDAFESDWAQDRDERVQADDWKNWHNNQATAPQEPWEQWEDMAEAAGF